MSHIPESWSKSHFWPNHFGSDMEGNMLMVLNAGEYFFKTHHIPITLSHCNGIIPCGDVKYLVK